MTMEVIDEKNRIVLFQVDGSESILRLVKSLGESKDTKYSWYDSQRRGPMFLIERKAEHHGDAFLLHQHLEGIFKNVYLEYLNKYNESGFSPRPNFLLTKMSPHENFMSHQDLNIEDAEEEIRGYVAIFYLNDDFTGGELYFDDLDITYVPEINKVIIFPIHLWHRVKTVYGQARYTAMILIEKYDDLSLAHTQDLWPIKAL